MTIPMTDKEKKIIARRNFYQKLKNNEQIDIRLLAKFLDICSDTIRKWEDRGIVEKPVIENGIRTYTRISLTKFFNNILNYPWQKNPFKGKETRIKEVADYLNSIVAISDTEKKRAIKEDPYAFDGKIY